MTPAEIDAIVRRELADKEPWWWESWWPHQREYFIRLYADPPKGAR